MDALSLMSSQGVSSIAVLRSDKFVLGNISMTDVKVIKKEERELFSCDILKRLLYSIS